MRFGVIGLGSIGLRHARNAHDMGENVIAFDPDEFRRALFAQEGGSVIASDEEIFSTCSAVIICSPNRFHLEHLRRAIDANCHALVEKPLSHSLDGLSDLLNIAEQKNLVIGVAMNLRFHPVAIAAKEIISTQAYGRPLWARFTLSSFLPSWRPHQDYRQGYTADLQSGGILLDVVHEPDLATFILGPSHLISASAHNTGALDIQTEDCANLVLTHGNVRSSIHMDYVSTFKRRFFEIQCADAFILGDLIKRQLTIYDENAAIIREEKFPGSFDDDYIAEMKSFISAVKNSTPYPCMAKESYDILVNVLTARKIASLPGA